MFASGSYDKTVKLWNSETFECLMTFSGHSGRIFSLCFSPDSKTLAAGSEDRTINIWDLEKQTEIKFLNEFNS